MKTSAMDCSRVRALLPLYLSGELDTTSAVELAAHLHICHRCAEAVSETRFLDNRLREAVHAEPLESAGVERRVSRLIADEARTASHSGWRWAAGLTAAAVLTLAAYTAVHPKQPPPLFAAAARDHRVEVSEGQLRRWRTAPEEVAQLASGRGIDAAFVGAIGKAGYRFKGARLCRLNGFVFLHLVYTGGAGDFSVFLRAEDGGAVSGGFHGFAAGKTIFAADLGAQHAAGFNDGALKAVIVTGQSENQALSIARAAAAVL